MPDPKNRLKQWAEDGYMGGGLRELMRDSLATIEKLEVVTKRLASEELFVPPIKVSKTFGVQINWVKEWDARIAYAKAALKENEEK